MDDKLSLKGAWSCHVTHFKFKVPLKYHTVCWCQPKLVYIFVAVSGVLKNVGGEWLLYV